MLHSAPYISSLPLPAALPISSCATSINAGMKPNEHDDGRQGSADPQGQVWQHEPRPRLGAPLVVLLPHAVCDLLAGAADLHADHFAQEQRGDFGGDQSLVGVPSDAIELHRIADIEPVPDVLPELG